MSSKHIETKNKKIRFSNILLLILIISAIVLIAIIGVKYRERRKNEEAVKEVVSQINNDVQNGNDDNQIPYIEYEGYQVIGTIQISKINIEYPILIETNEDSLEKSITRVGNGKVNEIGNLTLSGHNYLDGSMFGKIDKLEKDDEIYILDLYGNKQKYKVFDKYITNPNDVSVLESIETGKKEVTLVTCTNGNKNRLIIKAREA